MRRRTKVGRRWPAAVAVTMAALSLVACGAPSDEPAPLILNGGGQPAAESPAAESPAAQPSAAAVQDDPAPADPTDLTCTKATKARITRTANGYAFQPRRLSLKRGAFLAVTNTSDRVHSLIASRNAGIVRSVLARQERQVIQFPTAGTFTVASADTTHRAVLKVTVSGDSGCGAPQPTLTIVDGYAIRPARVSLAATENFAVVNDSGAVHAIRCTPGRNADNPRLARGETQLLALDEPGRYVCASVQHPGAKVTITVHRR